MFSTKYYDSETKMYYYGFRYYFSALGRWINRDPLEEDDFSNLYCYVGNNPVCASDFLGNKTLIDYLEERMLYLYNNHSGQMGSKFPIPLPWCTKTDCITYCYTVIEWAYRKIGRKNIAKQVHRKRTKGTDLAKYLQRIGWKAVYWNPDIRNPFDGDNEHPYSYKIAKKKKTYYGIKISDYVINYRPTPFYIYDVPKYLSSFNPTEAYYRFDLKPSAFRRLDTKKMTPKNTKGLIKLRKVRFGFGVARGGKHTFLYGLGNIYEVHWTGLGTFGNLYEKSPFEDYKWLSGAILLPPGNGVY